MTQVETVRLQPPTNDDFKGSDFCPAEGLTELAYGLVAKYDELNFIARYKLGVLWKRKGGQSKGRDTLGKCVKPTGLTAFFAGLDWVIWVAADHVRENDLDARSVEALLFHELNHCIVDKDDVPGVVGHDVEMFRAEVEEYGLWKDDLRQTAAVFRQLDLGGQFTNGDGA